MGTGIGSEKTAMPLTDILSPEGVLPAVKAVSKKQVLQELAGVAARQSGLSEAEIFEALLQRERLGSTGIGHGIAIPHGKLPKLPRLIGLFARLEKPVDFDALDGEPVDLVFLLLAPEGAGADHLKALSRVARSLRDPAIAQKLRKSKDGSALFALLTQEPTATAA
jgi:PTS system nitrogen regulatory IIA component